MNDWIQTYTGRKFYPLNPNIDDIDIVDIAHSLSMLCRYNGHSTCFYSVAEHSVYVSQYVKPESALTGLLHDASEAYLGDISKPIKPFLVGYEKFENRLMELISEKYNLIYPFPKNIKEIDCAILTDEKEIIMAESEYKWSGLKKPIGVDIECWLPAKAKDEFLKRYYELL